MTAEVQVATHSFYGSDRSHVAVHREDAVQQGGARALDADFVDVAWVEYAPVAAGVRPWCVAAWHASAGDRDGNLARFMRLAQVVRQRAGAAQHVLIGADANTEIEDMRALQALADSTGLVAASSNVLVRKVRNNCDQLTKCWQVRPAGYDSMLMLLDEALLDVERLQGAYWDVNYALPGKPQQGRWRSGDATAAEAVFTGEHMFTDHVRLVLPTRRGYPDVVLLNACRGDVAPYRLSAGPEGQHANERVYIAAQHAAMRAVHEGLMAFFAGAEDAAGVALGEQLRVSWATLQQTLQEIEALLESMADRELEAPTGSLEHALAAPLVRLIQQRSMRCQALVQLMRGLDGAYFRGVSEARRQALQDDLLRRFMAALGFAEATDGWQLSAQPGVLGQARKHYEPRVLQVAWQDKFNKAWQRMQQRGPGDAYKLYALIELLGMQRGGGFAEVQPSIGDDFIARYCVPRARALSLGKPGVMALITEGTVDTSWFSRA